LIVLENGNERAADRKRRHSAALRQRNAAPQPILEVPRPALIRILI
jgi:hypothetical protein